MWIFLMILCIVIVNIISLLAVIIDAAGRVVFGHVVFLDLGVKVGAKIFLQGEGSIGVVDIISLQLHCQLVVLTVHIGQIIIITHVFIVIQVLLLFLLIIIHVLLLIDILS